MITLDNFADNQLLAEVIARAARDERLRRLLVKKIKSISVGKHGLPQSPHLPMTVVNAVGLLRAQLPRLSIGRNSQIWEIVANMVSQPDRRISPDRAYKLWMAAPREERDKITGKGHLTHQD
jgi:hypothetical protein